jgi:phage gp36-like protein
MAWIALTSEIVEKRLTGPEIQAIQTAVLAVGPEPPAQSDPIPEEIEDASNEIRGYVAACVRNIPLAPKPLVPDKLKNAAAAIIIYKLCTRLPTSILLTPDRIRDYEKAMEQLREVAACKFAIDRPVVVDEVEIIGTLHGSISSHRCPRMGRDHEHGI